MPKVMLAIMSIHRRMRHLNMNILINTKNLKLRQKLHEQIVDIEPQGVPELSAATGAVVGYRSSTMLSHRLLLKINTVNCLIIQ